MDRNGLQWVGHYTGLGIWGVTPIGSGKTKSPGLVSYLFERSCVRLSLNFVLQWFCIGKGPGFIFPCSILQDQRQHQRPNNKRHVPLCWPYVLSAQDVCLNFFHMLFDCASHLFFFRINIQWNCLTPCLLLCFIDSSFTLVFQAGTAENVSLSQN